MSDDPPEWAKQMAKDIADIKAAMVARVVAEASALGVQVGGGSAAGGAAGGVATAAELDGPHGNPSIRSDPKRWSGESYVGCSFSQASPDYLDCLAAFKTWQADMDDKNGAKDGQGRPKSFWGRKDAKLALGWAARLRAGWKPKTGGGGVSGGGKPVTDEDYGDDDEVPFVMNATLFGRWDRP